MPPYMQTEGIKVSQASRIFIFVLSALAQYLSSCRFQTGVFNE